MAEQAAQIIVAIQDYEDDSLDGFGPEIKFYDHPGGQNTPRPHPNHGKEEVKNWFKSLFKARRKRG